MTADSDPNADNLTVSSIGTRADLNRTEKTPESLSFDADVQASSGDFGRYVIQERIGSGGFGTVFRALDPTLDRVVAIKVPNSASDWDPALVASFIKEARFLAKLQHAHVVAIYDAGKNDKGVPFIVMEYVDGEPLSRVPIEKETREERLQLLADVADAIHFAHKRGFVHRDLKPENILISKDGIAKVTDFGLAINEHDPGTSRAAGTPVYMSPEQITMPPSDLDGRSDIFSLGVILYEQLTGKRPFAADSRKDLYNQIISRSVKPPSQIDESISDQLESICLKCLEKDVAARPSNAMQVKSLLRIQPKPKRRAASSIASAIGVLLTLVCIVGFALSKSFSKPSEPLALTPIAWQHSSPKDHAFIDNQGSIHIRSNSSSACFATHEVAGGDFEMSADVDILSEIGYVGFMVNAHKTSIQPEKYNLTLLKFGASGVNSPVSFVITESEVDNSTHHFGITSSNYLHFEEISKSFPKNLSLKAEVRNGKLAKVMVDGRELPGIVNKNLQVGVANNTLAGVNAMGQMIIRNFQLKEL